MNIVKKSALVTGALAAALMVGCVSNKPLNTVGRLTLDTAHSNLSAVAIKNEKVPVDVKFPGLSGWAEASGQAELTIPISSLDTGNPERDTNIKDLFFEVAKKAAFGSASFKLDKIETDLSTLKSGQIVTAKGSGSLSLHGASLDLSGLLTFARKGNSVTVTLGEGWEIAINKTSLVQALKNLNKHCPQPHRVGNVVKLGGTLVFKA